MRFFVAVWKGHKAARLLLAATNAASVEDYDGALVRLQQAFDLGLPKHVEYSTMLGSLLSATRDDGAALDAFQAAFAMVDATPKYNQHEKNYLKAYIAGGTKQIAERTDETPDMTVPPGSEFSEIKLKKVRSLVKAMFPLPDHPDWVAAR